jgi:transcriptional antiterminator RfaH
MKSWYCIHIKPTKEDTVCHLLEDLPEVELFSPKIQRRKYLRSKPRIVVENLFPGYVFVHIDAPRYARTIRYTRGVRRMVGDHTGHPWTVDAAIIDYIRSRVEEGFIDPEMPAFRSGETVRITDGPLAGLEGIFLGQMNATERVIVLLNTLETQARVQIEKRLITKI